MKQKLRLRWIFLVFALLALFVHMNTNEVSAATTVKDFYFNDPNGQTVYDGGEMEMTTLTKDIYVTTIDGMNSNDTIEWSSSNNYIVSVESTGANTARLKRTGPGYARITARITRGNVYYSISMLVKVEVKIKEKPDGTSPKFTPFVPIAQNEQRAIVLSYSPDGNQSLPEGSTNTAEIILQYTVNPEIVNNELLTWSSSDETVVTVDHMGNITATGAGKAMIHIATNTMTSVDKAIEYDVVVIVNPMVNTNIFAEQGKDTWVHKGVIVASSDFYIQSNAMKATNLDWVVTDIAGNVITATSKLLKYKASNTSGTFEIQNAKVGVYYVKAYAKGLNSEHINVKYVDLTVVVPIQIPSSITMNVTDTYDLITNLNMATNFSNIVSINSNVVGVDREKGILVAKTTGTSKITVYYKEYADGKIVDTTTDIVVHVIDALALNLSDATIYAGGSIKLEAAVTNLTAKLTWSSSNPSVATVSEGVVTGLRAGETVITVSTVIQGVYKSASCNILVLPAVTSITIDPSDVSISIGEYKTLTAKITPTTINSVDLKWISSNEKVVKINEQGKKYVTIQGVSGGSAVITAINQQNVVVGFCNVTVKQPVTSIVLSQTNVTISLAESSFMLKATVLPTTATNQKLSYTSTNSSIVRVDDTGKVTLVSAGTAAIVVSSVDTPSISTICNVVVTTPVTGVEIDANALSMVVGESKRLTYTIIPTTASNKEVTWSTSDPRVCSISSTGTITAVNVGTATVTVTTKDGKYTKTCIITVSQYATALKLNIEDLTLNVGETFQMVVTATPASSTDKYTWETSNASVVTVSTTGRVSGKSEGTAIIIVKSNRGITAFCRIKVKQQATGIELNYAKKTVAVSDTFTLKATVLPKNATNQNVTYVSSDKSIATVTKKGKVKGIKGGTAIITVTSEEGKYEALCIVTVKELVTDISLPEELFLGKGKTHRLTPTITSNSATTIKLQWSSSNTKVATVSKKGLVKAVGIGTAKITVKATDGSKAKAVCTVRVIRTTSSISISPASISLLQGQTKALRVTIQPSNASQKKVVWSSSNEAIAMVDAKGNVTAMGEGSTIIKATTTDGTNQVASCIVTVGKKVASTSVTLADQSLVMVTGESKTVQAVLAPANTTDGFRWSTDNAAVATVDASSGRIVAKAVGTATITVMTDSGKTARISINVVGLSKTSLVLEQYTVYSRLEVYGVSSRVSWSVENPNIATINNGVVTARGIGKTNVVAIVNGRKLYCKLEVIKIK